MLNFTVGPVQSNDEVRKIGSYQVPYFRTTEFSKLMLENEMYIKKFAKANDNSKVVFITGSGTASMEACVMNILNDSDKALVINGGSFGQRFVDLCEIHNICYEQIKLEIGHNITKQILDSYKDKGFTCLLVNYHETSTGELYDIKTISDFCKENNLFLVVDAISSFLADEINFDKLGIDVMITGSQKALACPPGVSLLVLSENALERIDKNKTKCMYLDLKSALKNAERGQTPFTPAVSILIQINHRLKQIENDGGVDKSIENTKRLAKYFREKIATLPFSIVPDSCSNAVTALKVKGKNAYKIFETLKNEYDIWVCPNGGNLKDEIFRVGHIGYLTTKDYDKLIEALFDLNERGIL